MISHLSAPKIYKSVYISIFLSSIKISWIVRHWSFWNEPILCSQQNLWPLLPCFFKLQTIMAKARESFRDVMEPLSNRIISLYFFYTSIKCGSLCNSSGIWGLKQSVKSTWFVNPPSLLIGIRSWNNKVLDNWMYCPTHPTMDRYQNTIESTIVFSIIMLEKVDKKNK